MHKFNIFSKINFINTQNDSSWNLSDDSLIIKENTLVNGNILLETNNEITKKEIITDNCFLNGDQNIFKQSFKSERDTLSNSKKIVFQDSDKLNENENEIKRQLKLKRNRESAKNGRLRKKEFIENLINENNYLKNKYNNLLNIVHKCPKCNKTLEISKKEEDNLYICENDLLNERPKISNKKKFIFATAITLISIINIFNFPLNIMNYYNSIYKNKINFIRNLDNFNEEKFDKDSSYLVNKLKTRDGDDEALYIHFSEFYSMTKRQKIDDVNINNGTNKNIKLFKENQIDVDTISQNNASECVKCMVEINKNSIKLGGDEFTFYLVDRYLSNFFGNNTEDGITPQIDFDENIKKKFSKIFALKCKILAYSINDLYFDKFQNTK